MNLRNKCIFILLFFTLLLLIPAYGVIWSTPSPSQFNVTQDSILINWTNPTGVGVYTGNITLINNYSSSIILDITNVSTNIVNSTSVRAPFSVYGYNGTDYTYTNQTNLTTSTDARNTTIVFRVDGLSSGRYVGNLTIANATNYSAANVTNLTITLDIPISFDSTGLGRFAGNVSNSSEIYYFNTSNITYVAGFRINLTDLSSEYINVSLYDNSGNQKNSTLMPSNLTWINTTTNPTFPIPSAYWYINISNFTGDATYNATLELLKASLRVNETFDRDISDYQENITWKDNLGINRTITTTFNINNYADYNITINVTNSSFLNNSVNYMNYTIGNLTLIDGNIISNIVNVTQVNITIDTTKTSNSEGFYRGWILINSTNGYPYKLFNLSLLVNLTHQLNASITDVTNPTGGTSITAGNFFNITLPVKYQNGSFVSDLNLSTSNFIVWATHTNRSYFSNSSLGNTTLAINTVTADTINQLYKLYVQTNSTLLGGNYTLYVYVKDNNTNNLNYETAISNLTINETALKLTIEDYGGSIYGTAYDKTIGSTGDFYVRGRLTNYGAKIATGANISYTAGSCLSLLSGPSSTVQLGNLNPWGGENTTANSTTNPTLHWKFNATTAGTCNLTFTSSASGTQYDRQNYTITFTVTAPTTTATGGGGGAAATNTTKALSITDYPSSLEIQQNSSKSTIIKVKNVGAVDLTNVGVSTTGVDSSWYTISSEQNITKNTEKNYTLIFNIPATAEVKTYSITFIASATGVSTSVSSTLKVLPSNETQQQMVVDLSGYTIRYNNISKALNESKATGKNVSLAEEKLNQAKTLIDKANSYISEGKYFEAYELLSQIKTALDDAESALSSAELVEETMAGKLSKLNWIIIIVAVVIVVGAVVLFIYMKKLKKPPAYRPPVEYKYPDLTYIEKPKPKYVYKAPPGYTPPTPSKTFSEKIKEKFASIKEKFKK